MKTKKTGHANDRFFVLGRYLNKLMRHYVT